MEECRIAAPQQKHYEILRHDLVPNHEIISEKERKELLGKFNIKPEQLPKLLDTDPAAISIGAQPGQIIKITRKSRTAKSATAYRLVIESENR